MPKNVGMDRQHQYIRNFFPILNHREVYFFSFQMLYYYMPYHHCVLQNRVDIVYKFSSIILIPKYKLS